MDRDLVTWLEGRRGGETNEQFAARLNMSPSMWSRIRTGRRVITWADLGKIVTAFEGECSTVIALWRQDRAA